MYYRDRGACFEVGGGGGGGFARELFHAGRLDYYPLKKWGGHGPRLPLFRGPCIFACSGENSQLEINCVCAQV